MVIIHMSKAAYERGWTEPGETCEIEGVGPVPVTIARRMASDSIFKSLVVDGVDVTRISHHDQKTRHDLRRHGPPGQQRLVTKEEYARLIEAERGPPIEHAA